MGNERKVCSIVCGAPCKLNGKYVSGYVIAADGGYDRCLAENITPDLIIGDFDSIKSGIPENAEYIRTPCEKDETDSYLAACEAVKRGYDELRFFCALGGRLSHSLANIQILRDFKSKGIAGALFGEREAVLLLQDERTDIPRFSGYLSVFALDGCAEVSLEGVKYPLNRHKLTDLYPLGVSNEITAEYARITVHSGCCVVVLEPET